MSVLIESIIEKVRQHPKLVIAEDFEVAVQQTRSSQCKYYNGEVAQDREENKTWISLRILHRRQPGRAIIGLSSKEAIHGLVESAFESSRRSNPDPWFRFPLWKRPRSESEGATPGPELSAGERYPSLFSEISDRPEVFEEIYEVSSIETQLFRKTERFPLSSTKQTHGMKFSLLRQVEDQFFRLEEERGYGRPLEERREWLDTLFHQSSELKKGCGRVASAELNCLFGPAVISALLKRIVSWFYADLVQSGRSPLPLEKGGNLLSPLLTLIDDGDYPGAINAAPFDLEGTPTQSTFLIDQGKVSELLYDTYFATRENRISTGNFMRPIQALTPRITASNLYFKPSGITLGDLVRDLGSGIYLQNISSLELVPGTEREFLLRGSGWRLEGEECVHPVWDLSLQFDIFDLFRRVAQVGSDLTFYGAFGSPSILFEKVAVI